MEYNLNTEFNAGSLKENAYYFYNLGLNITCISKEKNKFNTSGDLIYTKAPNHQYTHLSKKRQTLEELNSYSWENATGLGVVTGFNNLITIDIDYCTSDFLMQTLNILKLPNNYEWAVLSGSGKGFHIYVFIDKITENFVNEKVIRLFPNIKYEQKVEKVELLIRLQSILPPSLHPSENIYKFVNCIRPNSIPQKITLTTLQNYMNSFFNPIKQINVNL